MATYELWMNNEKYDEIWNNGEEYTEAWMLVDGEPTLVWKKGGEGGEAGLYDIDGNLIIGWYDTFEYPGSTTQISVPHYTYDGAKNVSDYLARTVAMIRNNKEALGFADVYKVIFPDEVTIIMWDNGLNLEKTLVFGEIQFGSGLKTINTNFLIGCKASPYNYALKKFTVPKTVEMLKTSYFSRDNDDIEELIFEDGGENDLTIETSYAFYNCKNLKKVEFPSNLKTLTVTSALISDCMDTDSELAKNPELIIDLSKTQITKLPLGICRSTVVKELLVPETITELSSGTFTRFCNSSKIDPLSEDAYYYPEIYFPNVKNYNNLNDLFYYAQIDTLKFPNGSDLGSQKINSLYTRHVILEGNCSLGWHGLHFNYGIETLVLEGDDYTFDSAAICIYGYANTSIKKVTLDMSSVSNISFVETRQGYQYISYYGYKKTDEYLFEFKLPQLQTIPTNFLFKDGRSNITIPSSVQSISEGAFSGYSDDYISHLYIYNNNISVSENAFSRNFAYNCILHYSGTDDPKNWVKSSGSWKEVVPI